MQRQVELVQRVDLAGALPSLLPPLHHLRRLLRP